MDEEYPAIAARAKKERAEIQWEDETGIRSDHQTGTTYGRKGKTPVVARTGNRFRCNMLSSITNRGKLRFTLYRGKFTAEFFLKFLKRLIGSSTQKIFLILDKHPVHRAKKVQNVCKRRPDNVFMLESEMRCFLCRKQRNPEQVQAYFRAKPVLYAS